MANHKARTSSGRVIYNSTIDEDLLDRLEALQERLAQAGIGKFTKSSANAAGLELWLEKMDLIASAIEAKS